MASQQIHSAPSPPPGRGDVENLSKRYADGSHSVVTLRGRPIDKSKTGRMSAAKFVYPLCYADLTVTVSLTVGLLFYLNTYLHQSFSNGSIISNDFTGASFLLAVLGGFVADSYLGYYVTALIGGFIQTLGLGLFVFTAAYSGLQPPACTPTLVAPCQPAGTKYMAPIYVALYTIALGSGFVKAGSPTLGADQFDESDTDEKKQSVHYFSWFYFFQNFGLLTASTLSVYILNFVNKDWGFAWLLILYVVAVLIFLLGTPQYRHKRPAGSFLTRMVQVTVAAIRKRNLVTPEETSSLYDAPVGGAWIERSPKLRFLDRAAIVEDDSEKENRWKLAGVTQVEETKRILLVVPVWVSTWFVSLLFAQAATFTATQGQTLDRTVSKHFVIPPQSLASAQVVAAILCVVVFDKVLRPLLRKVTKNPYGASPLWRIGTGLVAAVVAMIVGALVERKRLGYIRDRGYTQLPMFELPMSMWWLLPQYFFAAVAEFGVFLSSYEFFFHELSENTRSIGLSLSFAAISLGYFFSSVLVDLTNSVTKSQAGGSWLVERFNNGGLESYYWLLAVICAVNFLFFLVAAYFYEYNYPLFRSQKDTAETKDDQRNMMS